MALGGGAQSLRLSQRGLVRSISRVTASAHWPRLCSAVAATALVAGAVGVAMVELLRVVQWVGYGQWGHAIVPMVPHVPAWRRVLVPLVAGLLCGLSWWWVRSGGRLVGAAESIRGHRAMHVGSTLVDALNQVVFVGSGSSLGREGAPRELAAAAADRISSWTRLERRDRDLLVAAAAGAGLAAVYLTPLSGAAFALEVVLRRRSWRAAAFALPVSFGAVAAASQFVGTGPALHVTPALTSRPDAHTIAVAAGAALAALPVGLVFAWFTRFVGRRRPIPGPWLVAALVAAGALTGLVEIVRPEVAGNGRELVEMALLGSFGVQTALVLVVAKASLTSGHLAAGAAGGLLMPSLGVGAATGVAVALLAGQPVAWAALLAGVVVLTCTQRAPLFASAFVWELTRAHWTLAVVGLLVAACTRVVTRTVGRAR